MSMTNAAAHTWSNSVCASMIASEYAHHPLCCDCCCFHSAAYFVRVRGGGEAGDRDAKVSKALGPIFTEAYLQSLQKRSCRLQPKFFGEIAQVNSAHSHLSTLHPICSLRDDR
jgi:hypothetical protein